MENTSYSSDPFSTEFHIEESYGDPVKCHQNNGNPFIDNCEANEIGNKLIEKCSFSSETNNISCCENYNFCQFNDCNHQITNDDLLDFVLRKYKIDKNKLIHSLIRIREQEHKMCVFHNFYKYNECLISKSLKEQYKVFKKWYCGCIPIEKEDFEKYYDKFIDHNHC